MKLPGIKAPSCKFVGEKRQTSAGRYKGEHHVIGQRRDKAVSLAREIGGGAFLGFGKRRDDCQPTSVEGLSLRSRQSQIAKAARERHYDRLLAAQQDIEALIDSAE